MNKIIVSNKDKDIISEFKKLNYKIIYTQEVEKFLPLENCHADMQINIINNHVFLLKESVYLQKELSDKYSINVIKDKINHKYPYNIALNALILNDYIIGKIEYLSKDMLEYALSSGREAINVNQGYTRCSCAIVNENSIITEDDSIEKKLHNTKINVLKIKKGFVRLDGAEYGFIGGAAGKIKSNELFFNGDISKHPDYQNIKQFCNKNNVKITYIKDKELNDIGGFILC